MGRLNRSPVDYWLTEDGLILLEAWMRDGCTLVEISSKMGINTATLHKWKDKYPQIAEALNTGKELVDYKVENALLKAALGYTTKEIKVTVGKKLFNGETVELLKETTTREVAPNVTACLAWLNNRKFDQWKRNRDRSVELDEEDNNISITIVRGPKGENDNVNQEIKLEKKPKEVENTEEKEEKGEEKSKRGRKKKNVEVTKEVENVEENNGLDEWPDDWNEE